MRSFGQFGGWQEGGQSLQHPAWSWSGTEEEDRHLMDEAPGDRSGRDFMLRQDGERLRYRYLLYPHSGIIPNLPRARSDNFYYTEFFFFTCPMTSSSSA